MNRLILTFIQAGISTLYPISHVFASYRKFNYSVYDATLAIGDAFAINN